MKFFVILMVPVPILAQDVVSVRDLKNGNAVNDSSYIYMLPYQHGRSFLLVQGYQSRLSHRNEIALDFKMRSGTKVCAMREGVVAEVRSDSRKGGLKRKYLSEGNYIMVRHADDTFAWYFHLRENGVFVHASDSVRRGQVIGLSGNTGYSAFPHLHVEVVSKINGHYQQIPTRFRLRGGIYYLKPGRFYRSTGSAD